MYFVLRKELMLKIISMGPDIYFKYARKKVCIFTLNMRDIIIYLAQ